MKIKKIFKNIIKNNPDKLQIYKYTAERKLPVDLCTRCFLGILRSSIRLLPRAIPVKKEN